MAPANRDSAELSVGLLVPLPVELNFLCCSSPPETMNPFQPFASILGIRLEDVPVVDNNLSFYETDSDFWLAFDVCSLKYCVYSTSGVSVTEWRYNPGYAVQDLQRVMEMAG